MLRTDTSVPQRPFPSAQPITPAGWRARRGLLRQVGLGPDMMKRYPHEFSGGQRQRICIARALALDPKVIVADESVSALDVSIKAQVCNLLMDLQQKLGISLLFISHDMAVVERLSHRVAVMYLGEIVEIGPREFVFRHAQSLLHAQADGRGAGPGPFTPDSATKPCGGRDQEPRASARIHPSDKKLSPGRRRTFRAGRDERIGSIGFRA